MAEKNFKNLDSLESVKKTLDEAEAGLGDPTRSIKTSSIPDALGAAVGIGFGGAASFAALYFGGTIGLSAAGITSGLAAAGGLVGGGMAAGIAVLAAPVAIAGVVGYGLVSRKKAKQLQEVKNLLLQEVIRVHDKIVRAQQSEINQSKERAEYLSGINILLQRALNDLKADLGLSVPRVQDTGHNLLQ